MTKEEMLQQAYENYEKQLAAIDKQTQEARKFAQKSLKTMLKNIREQA